MYWQRKFHLEYELPNKDIWKGMINTEADTKEELPNIADMRGIFWFSKEPEGWSGRFSLDTGAFDRRSKGAHPEYNFCITNGVYHPQRTYYSPPSSVSEAAARLRYIEAVKVDILPQMQGRIEDHIVSTETHCWE